MKDKLWKGFKLAAINYATFVVLMVTIELIGQFGYCLVRGKFLFERSHTVFEEHPYLVGVPKRNHREGNKDGTIFITTNELGFRVTGKKAFKEGGINVICLGGSTTFGTCVADEDSWSYILQERLGDNYNVYNLGVPGYSTIEAMIQLATLVPELNPDIVIIYQGWNDIRNYHVQPKSPLYYWHGMRQKTNLQVGDNGPMNYFFVGKLAGKIGKMLNLNVDKPETELYSASDPYIDSVYTRNLRTIKLLCDQLGAKSIFIPQVLNIKLIRESKEPVHRWTPHIPSDRLPDLIERFNALVPMSVKPDDNTVVVDSILQKYDWHPRHFADFGHFTKEGGELFAEIVLTAIKELESSQID